jgi:hypothetical protein
MKYFYLLAVMAVGCAHAPLPAQPTNVALMRQGKLDLSIGSAVEKQECFDALTDPNRYRTYPQTCSKCLSEP